MASSGCGFQGRPQHYGTANSEQEPPLGLLTALLLSLADLGWAREGRTVRSPSEISERP